MPSRAKRDGKLSRRSPSSLLLMVSVAALGPVLKTVEPQQFSALLISSSKLPGHWCKRGTTSMKNPGEWQGSEIGLRSRMCTLLLLATPETPPRKSLQNLNGISSFGEPADNGPRFCLWPPEILSRVFLALRHFSRWSFLDPLFPTALLHARVFQRFELWDAIHSACCSLNAAFIRRLFPYALEVKADS